LNAFRLAGGAAQVLVPVLPAILSAALHPSSCCSVIYVRARLDVNSAYEIVCKLA